LFLNLLALVWFAFCLYVPPSVVCKDVLVPYVFVCSSNLVPWWRILPLLSLDFEIVKISNYEFCLGYIYM